MKRFLPQSVSGRVLVAVVMAVVLINITSLLFYYLFRDEASMLGAASQAAEQIIALKHVVEHYPGDDREKGNLIRRLSSPVMRMTLDDHPVVLASDRRLATSVVLARLGREFARGTDIRVDSVFDTRIYEAIPLLSGDIRGVEAEGSPPQAQVQPNLQEPPPDAGRRQGFRRFLGPRAAERLRFLGARLPGSDAALFRVSIKANEATGTWFNVRVLLTVGEPQGLFPQALWLTAISLLIGAVAFWGVRRATQPLSVFASAAERLGVDVNAEPLVERGPSEVRRAAHAFNTMQTRVKRFIQDRTQMLAAISHDLRTPITRLRLRAEFVDDDLQRKKMLGDLDEMEAMISATLAFARDDAANESATHVDAAAIIASLCGDQRAAGRAVNYDGPDTFDLVARPIALKRAINNLVDNAVKYGKAAHVTLNPDNEDLTILIDDNGPGISPADKERVFAPFVRLESSRSRETGGTGLGLTIARNAIRSMGGDVELLNRAEGGLRVKVTLPVPESELLAAAE